MAHLCDPSPPQDPNRGRQCTTEDHTSTTSNFESHQMMCFSEIFLLLSVSEHFPWKRSINLPLLYTDLNNSVFIYKHIYICTFGFITNTMSSGQLCLNGIVCIGWIFQNVSMYTYRLPWILHALARKEFVIEQQQQLVAGHLLPPIGLIGALQFYFNAKWDGTLEVLKWVFCGGGWKAKPISGWV